MKTLARLAVPLALLVGVVSLASAQTATNIELTRAHIQKARQTIIADSMALTEAESLGFWPAYRDYRVDMARLGDRLVKVIAEFVSSEAKPNDEQATRLLDEYLDIKAKEVAVKQKHVRVFRKLLPPAKVSKFFQLENKLDAIVNYELAATIPLTR